MNLYKLITYSMSKVFDINIMDIWYSLNSRWLDVKLWGGLGWTNVIIQHQNITQQTQVLFKNEVYISLVISTGMYKNSPWAWNSTEVMSHSLNKKKRFHRNPIIHLADVRCWTFTWPVVTGSYGSVSRSRSERQISESLSLTPLQANAGQGV